MKRAMVLLLIFWIALQSGLAQAHMVEKNLHQLSHTVQATDESVAEEGHDESCITLVCCPPIGALYSSSQISLDSRSTLRPSTAVPLETAHPVDDIERPKWPKTDPGVAGI